MFAFIKMLILLRLAIVVSLTLYASPYATFAMHGDCAQAVTVSMNDAQAEHAAVDVSGSHEHGVAKGIAQHDQKQEKQNCCTDFCISLAIMAGAPDFGWPSRTTVCHFTDDGFVFGQLQSLHRPPNIRA